MQIVLEGINGSGELWLDIMKIICGDTSDKSMVDLGCHHAPYSPLLGFKTRDYIDIQNRPLDHVEEQKYFTQADIVEYLKHCPWWFSVSICSDVIEHLTVEKGMELLEWMRRRSSKSIIFTPLGEYIIENEKTDNPDAHRSGWTPEIIPQAYLSIVLPNFHPTLHMGAFFSIICTPYDEKELQRIHNEIKAKYEKN